MWPKSLPFITHGFSKELSPHNIAKEKPYKGSIMSQILEESLECLLPRTTYPNLMARSPRLMESFQVREVHPMRKVQGVLTKYACTLFRGWFSEVSSVSLCLIMSLYQKNKHSFVLNRCVELEKRKATYIF